MKTIAFFEVDEKDKAYLKEKMLGIDDYQVIYFQEHLSEDNVKEVSQAEIVSGMVYSPLNKSIIDSLPKLRLIATRSTGFDHIDLKECKKRGITVSNVPTYGVKTVAEHTFALMLALARKIPESIERTRKGDFTLEGLRGVDLSGKTLGVIGVGNIGSHVVKIARGFDMRVLGVDATEDKKKAERLSFEYVPLDRLLAESDFISFHVPLNDKTYHILNKNNIGKIKRGAYLINTARGGVVETAALIIALDKGILAGAALDVLEEECFIKEENQLLSDQFAKECDLKTVLENHMLLRRENVLMTPHNAFNSKEALQRILDTTVTNIKEFLSGSPANIVSI